MYLAQVLEVQAASLGLQALAMLAHLGQQVRAANEFPFECHLLFVAVIAHKTSLGKARASNDATFAPNGWKVAWPLMDIMCVWPSAST